MLRPTDIEIAPAGALHILPMEVLEDFADVSPTWFYLDEDSFYYEAESGRPSCVLRHAAFDDHPAADFVFTARYPDPFSPARLSLVHPVDTDLSFDPLERVALVSQFLADFHRYVDRVGAPIELHITERVLEDALA
ncbi:MAG: hypothetical protein D6685_00955 [Bacteroidetes bacterium]|nr:hypothetical protein AWN76_017835 [Rhodothermaceae bacterium RA]RMH69586.1 MAG: hypothetical protein D6685_00955 [Bacteroidota bacterium]